MKNNFSFRAWSLLAGLLCSAVAGPVHAADVPGPSAPAPVAAGPLAVAPSAARSPFAKKAVSPSLLAVTRAGSASAVVTETGSLQQTTATNVQTGANAIGGGSFANALGLTTVIQNSGANVLIQNATTINVQFK